MSEPSEDEDEGDGRIALPHHQTYTDYFNEVFPYYLSIGMTYELFWHGDAALVKAYRKAQEIQNQKRNEEMWMQGLYIYEALCDVAPILRAFAKKNAKPTPYATQPYPLKSEKKNKDEKKTEKKLMEKARRTMDTLATKINARFAAKKGVNENG